MALLIVDQSYYYNAVQCYAYLADLNDDKALKDSSSLSPCELGQPGDPAGEFAQCRWFTRGWCLQELIAPEEILFFNSAWTCVGLKSDLIRSLSSITGVHEGALKNPEAVLADIYSVAQKMSWAAARLTSRTEDIAYCLLGIFGVQMPMLYGEGLGAFVRLQEEIIRVSDDQTIFAWEITDVVQDRNKLLASHPRNFHDGSRIVQWGMSSELSEDSYTLTNRGLHIRLPIVDWRRHDKQIRVAALWSCRYNDDLRGLIGTPMGPSFGISSLHMPSMDEGRRLFVIDVSNIPLEDKMQTVYIGHKRTQLPGPVAEPFNQLQSPPDILVTIISRPRLSLADYTIKPMAFVPERLWNMQALTFIPRRDSTLSTGGSVYVHGVFSIALDGIGYRRGTEIAIAFGCNNMFMLPEDKGWIRIITFDATRQTIADVNMDVESEIVYGGNVNIGLQSDSMVLDADVALQVDMVHGCLLDRLALNIKVELVYRTRKISASASSSAEDLPYQSQEEPDPDSQLPRPPKAPGSFPTG
jgi:hypothetical protein